SSNDSSGRYSSTRLNANFHYIEPDLNEDPVDRYRTPGEDFEYGIWDGHHMTYTEDQHKDITFWGGIMSDIEAGSSHGSSFQQLLPGCISMCRESIFTLAQPHFTVVFCIIEMDKPDQPHNFEPQIYNMERGALDKLIDDYNTMSIWDFNEKYGQLWEFTIRKKKKREKKMAVCSSLSFLANPPVPKISSSKLDAGSKVLNQIKTLKLYKGFCSSNDSGGRYSSTRLNAKFQYIEPDLNEDPVDYYRTPGVDPEDFEYGIWDGHHTYSEDQHKGFISWLFLPAIAAGMYFNVPGEYLYIGAALFTIVFCIIEMDKPDQPHNFEPQIYNMERGARDKLINDYNTMSIWDFNEKYGHLWDFTIVNDDITKR
ncbi:hypothetical protein Tsubulata_012563, partial [Turnera subulata]